MLHLFKKLQIPYHLLWTILCLSSLTYGKEILQESKTLTGYHYAENSFDSHAWIGENNGKKTERKLTALKEMLQTPPRQKRKKNDEYSDKSDKARLNRGFFNEEGEEEQGKEMIIKYDFMIAGNLSASELYGCCKDQIKQGTYDIVVQIEGLLLNDEKSLHYISFETHRECEISYPKYYVKVKFLFQLYLGKGSQATQFSVSDEINRSIESGDLPISMQRQGLSMAQTGTITLDGGTNNFCAIAPSAMPTAIVSSTPSASPVRASVSLLFQIALTSGKTAVELADCCRDQILAGARKSISNVLAGLAGRRRFLHETEQIPELDLNPDRGHKTISQNGFSSHKTTLRRREETVKKFALQDNLEERKKKSHKCKLYYRKLSSNTGHSNQDSSTSAGSYLRSRFSEYNPQEGVFHSRPVSEPFADKRLLSQTHRKKDYTYCHCDGNNQPILPCENDDNPLNVASNIPTVTPSITVSTTPSTTPSNAPTEVPVTMNIELIDVILVYIYDNVNSNIDAYFSIVIRNRDTVIEDSAEVIGIMDKVLEDEVKSGRLTESMHQAGLNITASLASNYPSSSPSISPSASPSIIPSKSPTSNPSSWPSLLPSVTPTSIPTEIPSSLPNLTPSASPFKDPSTMPSIQPSLSPSSLPSQIPSVTPSISPSSEPSAIPTVTPSDAPTLMPSSLPNLAPSASPFKDPSTMPSIQPSLSPSSLPSQIPSVTPSISPSSQPTGTPSLKPSSLPSSEPSISPTNSPSSEPTATPTRIPSDSPSATPSIYPSSQPTGNPSMTPSRLPSNKPSSTPSSEPSLKPSPSPSVRPSAKLSSSPTYVFYEYVGCFNDKLERALPYLAGKYMETKECQLTCSSKGFKYAGLQWWGECYCADNGYDRYGSGDLCNCGGPNFGKWNNCVYEVELFS